MIAVTGASGLLGQWVVAALTRAGHDVLCVARRPAARPTIAGLTWVRPVTTLACDLGDAASVAAATPALAATEAVVHLAGHVPDDTARNDDADAFAGLRTNALGTAHLLHALAAARGLRAVVYASTAEVYGAPVTLPVDEGHRTLPLSHFGATRLAGEKYLRLFDADRGVPGAALRLPEVYGPGDRRRHVIGDLVRAAADGRPLELDGDGGDRHDLVYAGDVADAIASALAARVRGTFNLGSGAGLGARAVAAAVVRAAGGRVTVVERPRGAPRLDCVLDVARARRELAWAPRTSLEDGVAAQLAWVRGEPRAG